MDLLYSSRTDPFPKRSTSFSVGLPRTVCDFVCILSVIAIEFLSSTSSKELPTKAAIALNHTLRGSFYACAVVELRFMTERNSLQWPIYIINSAD